MMTTLLLLAALAVGPVDVTVQPLSGPPVEGVLQDLSDTGVTIESDGRRQTFRVDEVVDVAIQREAPAAAGEPSIWIDLVDGSRLPAASFNVTKGDAAVELAGSGAVDVPTAAIDAVRFHDQTADLAEQWRRLRDEKGAGDVLVIRRTSTITEQRGDEEIEREVAALDSLEGVVFDVTPEIVNFQFDGDLIPVKREKVEGIIYFHRAGIKLPDPVCCLYADSGQKWFARTLSLKDGAVELATVSGVKTSLPLSRAVRFDFSAGKIVFLSNLEPARVDWMSYFDAGNSLESLARLYRPRRDRSFDGGKLKLAVPAESGNSLVDREYDKGLAVHSRTEIEYRLPGEFKHLVADMGIDARVRDKGGHVVLTIRGDGKELHTAEISGDMTAPIPLDVEISGVRRLTILVDFGEGLDIADHLNLCNLRVTK